MNLLYANPVTLAFHYLLLYIYGNSLDSLHSEFATKDRSNDGAGIAPEKSGGTNERKTFDFIIVGGGSGGAVLANRLSETNATVLLIEAGGNPFPLTSVPALAPILIKHPNIDWSSEIVPQKFACQALTNKGPIFSRGKLLGGGSNLNFMIYMRGCPNDFNNWANLTADPSWTYENLLPYFKKLENYEGNFPNSRYHGTGGPLHVSKPPPTPLQAEFFEAGQELGYQLKDPNGYQTESIFPFDTTTKDGTRYSTQRAYLYPVMSRANLKIQIYSHVTQIHFDERNRAIGVSYTHKGKNHTVTAGKEVILSAGAFGSPQILMLSGIGPTEHLKSLGIPARISLPVGQSLQDHPVTMVGPFIVKDGTFAQLGQAELVDYINKHEGPFATLQNVGGALFASSLASTHWPDIYLTVMPYPVSQSSAMGLELVYGIKKGILQKYLEPDYGKDAFFMVVALALPRSRGEVKLRSKDPFDKVIIDPKYFHVKEDLQAFVEGVQKALKLGNDTSAFRKLGVKFTSSLFPGCEKFSDIWKDDYWKCYLTQWSQTMWHYTSTCRMGRGKGDPLAVVDPNLRVIGTIGLRVVDGSVMPAVTNANTNIPIIMIAERAAEIIKKAWKLA